jgi:hypothetical protein
MNYYVFYVKDCSPKVKKFKTKLEAEYFAACWTIHNQDNNDDNWVDFIVKGKVKPIDKNYIKAFKELK